MDKIEKALQKLSFRERARVKRILEQLKKRQFTGLDVKRLRGQGDIYRVRKGDIRIIYRAERNDVFMLAIERKSESTYRF